MMHSDGAIRCCDDDQFERKELGGKLARVLTLKKGDASIVLGLEGDWGSGKTSIINMIKDTLKTSDPEPVLVDFNPWLIASLDSVLEGFLVQLAASLGTSNNAENAKNTARKVLSFAKFLTPIKFIPGAEPWASLVQRVLEGVEAVGSATEAASEFGAMDLSARKRDVQKAIDDIDRPIIVFIDDVDRLPPQEVRLVFQMVKAVANFDRVAYLLAYDTGPVKKALSFDEVYDGGQYLEKIVQLAFPMPRLSFYHKRKYFYDHVADMLAKTATILDDDTKARLEHYLDYTSLLHALRTPREIVRLINKVRMSILVLGGEVNVADLIAFWCIEMRFPCVFKDIAAHTHHYLDVYGDDRELDRRDLMDVYVEEMDTQTNNPKPYLTRMLKKLVRDPVEQKIANSILRVLFPKSNSGNPYSQEIDMTRLSHKYAFLKVMHHCAPGFTMPYAKIRQFANSPNDREALLREYADLHRLGEFITYLQQIPKSLEIIDPVGLCDIVINELGVVRRDTLTPKLASTAGELIHLVWMRVTDKELRDQIVEIVAGNKEAIGISEAAIFELMRHYGIWRNGRYFADATEARHNANIKGGPFSYHEVYSAKDRWLQTVRNASRNTDLLKDQVNILSIFYRWGQLSENDYAEPVAYVKSKCHDPDWLYAFIKHYDPHSNLSEIATLIPDPEPVIALLEEHFPDDKHAKVVADVLRQKIAKEEKATEDHA